MMLFVGADRRECEAWVRHWERVSTPSLPVHWARAGVWKGGAVLAIANGAGAKRAQAAVAAAPGATAICSIGFCGALDPGLSVGDVFAATQVRSGTRSFAVSAPRQAPEAASGALVSVDAIVQTAAEKKKLHESGAAVVEMEAAAVAAASEELNVPFFCIRAVSDPANEGFFNNFNDSLMPDGRFSVTRLVTGAMKSPVERFGELIRLSRRTAVASNNLGEFLARCDF